MTTILYIISGVVFQKMGYVKTQFHLPLFLEQITEFPSEFLILGFTYSESVTMVTDCNDNWQVNYKKLSLYLSSLTWSKLLSMGRPFLCNLIDLEAEIICLSYVARGFSDLE